MDAAIAYLKDKKSQLDDFLDFHTRRIQPHLLNRDVRIYIYELPKETEMGQYNHFLLDTDMYKEDYGTYRILLDAFREYYSVSTIEQADFILFPFNVYFHNRLPQVPVKEIMNEVRKQAGQKKIILFSFSDFCLKPVYRSTIFERQLFEHLPDAAAYFPGWVEPGDIFIHFESTLDFIHYDIPVFPLVQQAPVSPLQQEKEWLFSFVGEYYKEGWPEGFVRSPSNKETWEQLAGSLPGNALIVSTAQAKTMYNGNPFFEIPERSVFTLCPRGISSWTFRVFEAILSGSIPVILSDSYSRPFAERIPWDSFSLTFPENRLHEIAHFLQGIQPGVTRQLQANLQKNQHWFTANGLLNLINDRLLSKISGGE